MKVLMFGWEFPPHISGGLGTACFGLTRALAEENISIHFVVPKAYGDEQFPVIAAADFVVTHENTEMSYTDVVAIRETGTVNTVSVRSTLTPYTFTEAIDEHVEHWSWEFSESQSVTKVRTRKGGRHEFTGKYGPGLLDEVERYAEVAAAISEQFDFDVIHAHDWLTYLAGIEAKRVSGRPLVIHVHATEFDRAGEKNIDHRVFEIEKKGMELADLIIAVSQWTKNIIVDKYKVDGHKVRVVYNGITGSPALHLPFLPKVGDHVVTFLGRITYQKGPQYFVEAAKKVLDYLPNTHFVMAGSGDLLPATIDHVARLRLSSRIHFTGFLRGQQLHQIWPVTDIYVMPSVSEPFGITPLEAAQAGVPVIVSNQSGVAEVIDHAIKVDFWDTDTLANAIVNILRHKALAESLKDNSSEEIESLTWKRAAVEIINLYREVYATN